MVRKEWKIRLIGLLLLVALPVASLFLVGFEDIARRITVICDGNSVEVRTNKNRPAEIISEAGFTLERGDGWRLAGVNKRVQDGCVIEVLRGKPFTVIRGGVSTAYRSYKSTVGEALRDMGIAFSRKRIYPNIHTELVENMQIYVLEKGEEFHYSEAPVEIPVKYEEDHRLLFGNEEVKSEGKPGKAIVVSKRSKKNRGQPDEELTRTVTVEPEHKVIRKGMGMSVWTPEGYKRYTKRMKVSTTAYVATGNKTALGKVPHVGTVAVDPKVIPFYTKMYIPGYGIGTAGDTGGSIKGKIIDLFFDSYSDAIQWGRKDVEIYILAE